VNKVRDDAAAAADPRIALLLRQLDLAYDRRSWHGPNLRSALRGVGPEEALDRPQQGRHNIQEIAVHCAYWKYRVVRLLEPGVEGFSLAGSDWFERAGEPDRAAWQADLALLGEWHDRLKRAVAAYHPKALETKIRGEFTAEEVVSGIAAHDLYHAGQIRLLRRMQGDEGDGEG